MDRFKLNTKALLGLATRTVDQDHELRHTCAKTLNQNVIQYEAAILKLAESFAALSAPLEGVVKAYINVIANEKHVFVCDGVKEMTGRLEEISSSIIPEFVGLLAAMVGPSLSTLKDDCSTCEKLHADRVKAVDTYDYYRDLVERKEVQYAAKGKLLDASKHYKDDVNKLDTAKKEYIAKNAEYNKTYDELMCKKSELTTISAKVFARSLLDFIDRLHDKASRMCGIAENISAALTAEGEAGVKQGEEECVKQEEESVKQEEEESVKQEEEESVNQEEESVNQEEEESVNQEEEESARAAWETSVKAAWGETESFGPGVEKNAGLVVADKCVVEHSFVKSLENC